MDRRKFLGLAGAVAATAAVSSVGQTKEARGLARPTPEEEKEFVGILVDTTRCIGCRQCEIACAEAHGLPVPDPEHDNALVQHREPTPTQWTVVNKFETDKGLRLPRFGGH